MMPLPPRQHGVALILVIWVTLLLTVIAGSFAYATRTDMAVVQNSVSRARLEAAADAAVQRAIFELFRPGTDIERWQADGVTHSFAWNGHDIAVSISDQSAKLDINAAAPELLKGLLLGAGADNDAADRLLDAIQDWRDSDTLRRVNGAEEADYRAAGLQHVPANVPFQTIEELRLVLGMTPELYRRMAPLVTVYSRQPGINAAIATRDMLLVIPGATAEQVDAFIAERDAARAARLPLPQFLPASRFGSAGNSLAAGVRAEVNSAESGSFVREVVVRLLGDPRRPYVFLAWSEGTGSMAQTKDEVAGNGDDAR